MTPEIIYEDNHILIVNKPSGILSQRDISGKDSMLEILKSYVKTQYGKQGDTFIGLVHRLDLPVSGLMVFAKTSKAARRLHLEIVNGNMDKYYTAVVEKEFTVDKEWHKLENFLTRINDKTIIDKKNKRSKKSELYYTILASSERYSLVLIKLETGRKHQIRAQFSALGAPIAGDIKYGSTDSLGNSITLHSTVLSFNHPTLKDRMVFSSNLPDTFAKFIKADLNTIKDNICQLIDEFKN
jgi:23S rRNA pseudouridine1911/1915/1917 synthase